MFETLKKTFTSSQAQSDQVLIKVDPVWGYAEFPQPGEFRKNSIPIFIDPEEEESVKVTDAVQNASPDMAEIDPNFREYWMPDRLCKVCYCCEDPFTMFRRRHHCRFVALPQVII